jgi:hypothetical protein
MASPERRKGTEKYTTTSISIIAAYSIKLVQIWGKMLIHRIVFSTAIYLFFNEKPPQPTAAAPHNTNTTPSRRSDNLVF